jgi:hypothetical protein
MAKKQSSLKMRVKELIWVKGKDIIPHPNNWRRHPTSQISAFRQLAGEIGFSGVIIGRYVTRKKIKRVMALDGHLRIKEMPDQLLPVIILDLTEKEAKLLLLSYDPLGEMARVERDKIKDLMGEMKESQIEMLTNMQGSKLKKWANKDIAKRNAPQIEFTTEVLEANNYVMFVFDNEMDWNFINEHIEIETKDALDSRKGYTRRGIGRVLDGQVLIDLISEVEDG